MSAMPETYTCDYCRAAIDPSSDAALITRVHRHVDPDEWADDPDLLESGQHLTLRFCSQQHMGTYMERVPLPASTANQDMGTAKSFGVVLLVLIGVALAGFGAFALVRDLL